MANTKISNFVAGGTAQATDRIAAARSPFAANSDDVYLLPSAIAQGGLNDSYHTVVGYGATDTANGTELVAAYANAKTLTPGGNALSAGNRHTILVLPGNYLVGDGSLVLDTEFIDIIGISPYTGATVYSTGFTDYGDTIIYSTGHTLGQTANNVCIANLCLLTTSASKYAWNVTSALSTFTRLINVLITNSSAISNAAMNPSLLSWAGAYTDVRCWNESSFGNVNTVVVSGTFLRCKAGGYSFGCGVSAGNNSLVSGTFTDCEADGASFGTNGTASGTFRRCVFVSIEGIASPMFGGNQIAQGTFEDCEANGVANGSFGLTASGTFLRCRTATGASPIGGGGFGSGASGVASGTFIDCEAGASSFGTSGANGGTASGVFINCKAGINSFAGGGTNPGTMSGFMYNCVLQGRLNANVSGRIERMSIVCLNANETAVLVANNAILYLCTFIATGTGFSVDSPGGGATIKAAQLTCNKGFGSNVTNAITTPYIVSDANAL